MPRNSATTTPSPWQHFVDRIPDCVIGIDQDGCVVMSNPAASLLLGYSSEQLAALGRDALIPSCTDCADRHRDTCRARQSDRPQSCEVVVRHRDGTPIPVLMSISTFAPPDATQAPMDVAVLKDIRGMKQTQAQLVEQKERFEILFNSISDAVFLAPLSAEGVHGNFVQVNDVACTRLGYSRQELLGMNARSINPAANNGRVRSFGRHIRREGETAFEAIHVARNGAQIPVRVVAKVVRFGDQDYVLSMVRDQREQELPRQAESRLGRLLEHTWDEIYVFHSDTLRFVQVNQGATENLGYAKNELTLLGIADIAPKLSQKAFRQLTQPLFDGSESRIIYETLHRRKNGTVYPVEVRLQLSHSEVPPVFLANVQDITERRKIEKRLKHLANYDALTGLPNRALFLDRLGVALETCRRKDAMAALIFLDLDGFKSINDTLGHDAGDKLIKEIGRRLKGAVRRSDTVARLGGDEFTVILADVKCTNGAEIAAKRIIRAVAEPVMLGNENVRTTVSMGIALFSLDDQDNPYSLIKKADSAMYQAKQLGKNNFQFYADTLAQLEMRRFKLENALKSVLARRELALHYQPRVDLGSMKVIGCEALLRWTSPDFGAVSPVEFIPIMEATGQIRDIGLWVLNEACRQLHEWLSIAPGFRMSINVSARQFDGDRFLDQLRTVLDNTGVPPDSVEVEITEGVLIANSEQAERTLHELKQIGVTISLDDFGSGYSSLSYLRQFPIDIVKIDRSFIDDVDRNNDSTVIVEAIIGLAHNLDLRVTAEGVERVEHLEFLQKRGCDEVQGYLFGKPMAPEQFADLLEQQAAAGDSLAPAIAPGRA
jgi:diguanylate cyclase (GGDEF)-like protein/PAS domain S-box-containing protein